MGVLIHPDRPLHIKVQAALERGALRMLANYRSGNPWLIHDVGAERPTIARSGAVDVAVIGRLHAPGQSLEGLISDVRDLRDFDQLVESLPDSVFIAAVDATGAVCCRGTSSGSSAAFWVRRDSGVYISDSQIMLAEIFGLGMNIDELCVRLSDAEVSYPYLLGTIWDGVEAVEPGSWIWARPDEAVRVTRWWQPPEPNMELRRLAPSLSEAIRSVLGGLLAADDDLSCDLSGGLDSTSLAYFAKEFKPGFHTLFLDSADATNADRIWADRAARDLETDHHVLEYATVAGPALVHGHDLAERLPEGPSEAARYIPLVDVLTAESGPAARLHLNGHGGDELFGAVAGMSWSLVRSRHPRRFRDAIGFGQVNKQSMLSTLKLVLRGGSVPADLRHIASGNFDRPHDEYAEGSRWVPSVLAPAFLTPSAREHLRSETLRLAWRLSQGLHADRSIHRIREAQLFHGALLRRMNLMPPRGALIEFAAPYLDRRVAEAAMRLRIEDRFNARLVKPLLAEARPASMPLDYFQRRDKGEYSAETFNSFKSVRRRLLETFEHGSFLEDQGLLDPGEFRRSVSGYSADGRLHEEAMRVELAELWMRSMAARRRTFVGSSPQ